MTDEIKAVARRHLETEGANLSLRAVARDMGMVSSALYRYFASRDELLTALILDAYNALADVVAAADEAVTDRSRLRARWLAAAHAIRDWALARPAEYALLYGSPVPGYVAPEDTVAAASRIYIVLARILADGFAAGALPAPEQDRPAALMFGPSLRLADALRADLTRTTSDIAPGLPEQLLFAGLTAWIQLFGHVSLELFGQFNNVVEARDEFFDLQLELTADLMGL
jgi:AcrR family transcriptional regulator